VPVRAQTNDSGIPPQYMGASVAAASAWQPVNLD